MNNATLPLLAAALTVPTARPQPPADPIAAVAFDFSSEEDLAAFEIHATGEAARRMPSPKLHEGSLYLLESWWKSTAAAALPAPTDALARVIEARFTLTMNTGTEGFGFAWLAAAEHGADAAIPEFEPWESPAFAGSFGVGFDASDPPNREPFRGSGNVYDRPQHEVSLHWDGAEVHKKVTPTDFRDEQPHPIRILVEFVPGGADISIWIDDVPVYDRYFVPSMAAFAGRPVFGARNSETAGDVMLDDLRIECREPIDPPDPPLTVVAIDHAINDAANPTNEAEVAFPDDTSDYARIICTLRLDKPETRFDPWDRIAHVYAYADDGERFELLRYITPYDRGGVWMLDVSDFRPLLRSVRRIEQHCGTQGEGWVVTVAFDFYPGRAERLAYRVLNLWSGSPEIGNPDRPASDFYVPRTIALDDEAESAKVRSVVTGHGMFPNTNNAAEFMPLGRTLTINGEAHTNVLWKTDNYLNPCRPQGGTWKYDRAGWAPGDVVRPWEVEVPLDGARELHIEYALDPYANENRGKTWAPFHRTEAQLILYRVSD